MNKISLVLGGGGVRGFFHMGVIKALTEMKVEIGEISGTSIGAVVGAIYASNPEIDFEKMALEFNYLEIAKEMIFKPNASYVEKIEIILRKYILATNFEDLKIPLTIVAVDINNGKEVVFSKGNLFPAIIASMSIPGILPPFKMDDKYLVDGGILNNVPMNCVDKNCKILVSDITGPIKKIDEKSNVVDILLSTIGVMQKNMVKIDGQKVIYLQLEDTETLVIDFRKENFQKLIDLGYQAAMKNKDKVLRG